MHAQAFRKHRKSMGLTQAQMASLLRLPLGTLKKLEAGTLDPPTSKKLVRAIISKDLSLARSTKKLQRTRK
jgi:predicted transcriptional regulator